MDRYNNRYYSEQKFFVQATLSQRAFSHIRGMPSDSSNTSSDNAIVHFRTNAVLISSALMCNSMLFSTPFPNLILYTFLICASVVFVALVARKSIKVQMLRTHLLSKKYRSMFIKIIHIIGSEETNAAVFCNTIFYFRMSV